MHMHSYKKIDFGKFENPGVKVGKPKILEKNSPKIGGRGEGDQF